MSSSPFDITTPLSDLIETTLKEGPQVVTMDGVETAVLVSIDEWKSLKAGRAWKAQHDGSRQSIKDVLLDSDGPHDIYIPPATEVAATKPNRSD